MLSLAFNSQVMGFGLCILKNIRFIFGNIIFESTSSCYLCDVMIKIDLKVGIFALILVAIASFLETLFILVVDF